MGKTFVVGDIHNAYKAFLQCMERSGFDKENDTLISLGDIVDGWNSGCYELVEELLSIPNLIAIKGNHDDWFREFIQFGVHPVSWLQGGEGTLQSYCDHLDREYTIKHYGGFQTTLLDTDIPITHRNFFLKQHKYYKDENNNLFVHGGFNRHHLLSDQQDDHVFWWDRDLWMSALSFKEVGGAYKIKEPLNEIFIGHTATTSWFTDKPMQAANITNLDTGSGFRGKLTFMDLETKEYFQSDKVDTLYPGQKGRNKR